MTKPAHVPSRKTKHVLRMSCGVVCTMTFDEETAKMICHWSSPPPWSRKMFEQIRAEYEPWRDEIFAAWAERNNKKVLLLDL